MEQTAEGWIHFGPLIALSNIVTSTSVVQTTRLVMMTCTVAPFSALSVISWTAQAAASVFKMRNAEGQECNQGTEQKVGGGHGDF